MAGREGLVDTAVKTSRSGYLQRYCLIHTQTAGPEPTDGILLICSLIQDNLPSRAVGLVWGNNGLSQTGLECLMDPHRHGKIPSDNINNPNFMAVDVE